MMIKEYVEDFLGKIVNVGIPHRFEDRLFYFTGEILEVTDKYLILRKKDGLKQIQLEDVAEITINKGGQL